MIQRQQCSILGFGRFGQLLAEILRQEFSVVVHDIRPDRRAANALGVESVDFERACQSETLFLCVPISTIESVLKQARPLLPPGSLVIDTCSVKIYPASVMESELPETVQILATHPLFGPDSAKNGLEGLRIIFCPLRIDPEMLAFWRDFWQRRGVRVLEKTPQEHDREAAYAQGITHLLGRVLGELHLGPSEVSTKGYEAILGVIEQTNHDTWELFHDLQRYNPFTNRMRRDLVRAFNTIVAKLGSQEIESDAEQEGSENPG